MAEKHSDDRVPREGSIQFNLAGAICVLCIFPPFSIFALEIHLNTFVLGASKWDLDLQFTLPPQSKSIAFRFSPFGKGFASQSQSWYKVEENLLGSQKNLSWHKTLIKVSLQYYQSIPLEVLIPRHNPNNHNSDSGLNLLTMSPSVRNSEACMPIYRIHSSIQQDSALLLRHFAGGELGFYIQIWMNSFDFLCRTKARVRKYLFFASNLYLFL